jgi:putative ABC transport system ATP-binding protein
MSLVVEDLVIEYSSGGYLIRPIDHLNLRAEPGELVVLLGASGCGKTSLLSVIAGILTPASGTVRFGSTEVTGLRGPALSRYRRETVGVVFQAFNLIPSLTAVQNVQVPILTGGVGWAAARARAEDLLIGVALGDRFHHRPDQLSGGQQQRVAIARALGFDPPLVLADEPTAHLDYVQVEGVVAQLRGLADAGRLVVVATHDDRILPLAHRVVELTPRPTAAHVAPRRVELGAGAVLFRQGDESDLIYEIESGTVEVLRELSGGGEELVAVLDAGVYVGELGPLLGVRRSATVRARSRAVVVGYAPVDFRQRVGETLPPDPVDGVPVAGDTVVGASPSSTMTASSPGGSVTTAPSPVDPPPSAGTR